MRIPSFLPGSWKARKMVALASLSQNCSVGLALGSYGALIPSIEATFHATRAGSSLGFGLYALVAGVLSPLVGVLLRRIPVRTILVAGAVANAIGYLALSMVGNLTAFLTIFALFAGMGTAMMGVIAPATLVSRWYREARGRALGLVTLPVFLILIPPIAAGVVERFGMTTWFLCAAATFVMLIPVMLMVVDEPELVGEAAYGAVTASRQADEPPTIRMAAFLANPRFWLLTIGVGVASGSGNAFLTHIIPYARASAISLQSSSLLLTVYGISGLVGNLFFGWLADRIGAAVTLSISALGQALLWAALLTVSGYPMLLGIAALLGMFTTSVIGLHGAAVNELFGRRNVSGVMGLGYFFKVPFNFGAAPLAGYLYVAAGNYVLPFGIFSAAMVATALGFVVLAMLRSGSASEGVYEINRS